MLVAVLAELLGKIRVSQKIGQIGVAEHRLQSGLRDSGSARFLIFTGHCV
jgi:hypothetical protein